MNGTQEHAAADALSTAERRHLLRRLAFAATPELDLALRGLSRDDALSVLVRGARQTPYPEPPPAARGIWSNPALRLAALSDADFEAIVDRQAENARAAIENVRRWWLAELLSSPARGRRGAPASCRPSGPWSSMPARRRFSAVPARSMRVRPSGGLLRTKRPPAGSAVC